MGSVVTAAGRRRLRVGGVEPREARPTPLGALARGLAAGVVGNLAMDWSQRAVYKIRGKETGNWQSWDEAPMAAQVAKRVYEGVLQREAPPPSPEIIGRFHKAAHWTYGPAWAGLYGIVEASISRRPLRHGVVFGLFMWVLGSGLAGPATKLAKRPWKYGWRTNASMSATTSPTGSVPPAPTAPSSGGEHPSGPPVGEGVPQLLTGRTTKRNRRRVGRDSATERRHELRTAMTHGGSP